MPAFLEGVESIALPCSLVILLPSLALLLASRSTQLLVGAAYLIGASMLMWARAGRLWEFESTGLVVLVIAAMIAAGFLLTATGRGRWGGPAAGLVVGAIAGWMWQPCVGTEFGEILNTAEQDRLATLVMMHVYVAGILLPTLLLAVLPHAVPRLRNAARHTHMRTAGLVFGLIYAVTVALGRHDEVVGELFRMSTR